jgi:hypothetical protein
MKRPRRPGQEGRAWNDQLDKGGVVVSDEVFVSLDVEAILAEDLAQA